MRQPREVGIAFGVAIDEAAGAGSTCSTQK